MIRKGFLIDMDGVIYKGSEPIPGAVKFINDLREKNFHSFSSQTTAREPAAMFATNFASLASM
jgi:NagD protein